ncbi:MAG: iron ABC transporter permease [Archangium sp.]|nr:iron ABC transporter permease [Archangium sp.]
MTPSFSASRLAWVLAVCAGVVAVSSLVALAVGQQPLTLTGVLTPGSTEALVFFSLRLPRVVLTLVVGAALAASGAALQALTRNPLADPFILGVSGGAALGATVALALGLTVSVAGLGAPSVFAMVGAVGATAVVLSVGRIAGGARSHATLLAGVIFNAFALAAIVFIKTLVAPDKLGEILFWLAGTLGHEAPSTLAAAAVVVAGCLAVLVAQAGRLNVLLLGDADARSLGLDVGRTRLVVFVAASVAVATAASMTGLIGFVGLLVPHLARLLFGTDQRVLVPASALLGAAFLALADATARALFHVFNTEPPVGVVTALLGAPAFLALLVKRGPSR